MAPIISGYKGILSHLCITYKHPDGRSVSEMQITKMEFCKKKKNLNHFNRKAKRRRASGKCTM